MSSASDVSLLAEMLGPDCFGALESAMERGLFLDPGTKVQELGEPTTHLIVVRSGALIRGSASLQSSTALAGEVVGGLHFICGDRSAWSLVSGPEGVTIDRIGHAAFIAVAAAHADFWRRIACYAARVARSQGRLLQQTLASGIRVPEDSTRVAFFGCKPYMRSAFESAMARRPPSCSKLEFFWISHNLERSTVPLAAGCRVACIFVNDRASADVIEGLRSLGVSLLALRCAGFDNVDLAAAAAAGLAVTRVPRYSPNSVAEFTIALMLAANRKVHKSWHRSREFNFDLSGLVGFDMAGKTVGVIGSGNVGALVIKILEAFDSRVLVYDTHRNPAVGGTPQTRYVDTLDEIWAESDVITLHVPLMPETRYIINATSLAQCKDGILLVNTSRGGLIDTEALLAALRSGKVKQAALDVYEHERGIFFEDGSGSSMQDPLLANLISLPNVIVASHQAFLTQEALDQIALTVLKSLDEFVKGGAEGTSNRVVAPA